MASPAGCLLRALLAMLRSDTRAKSINTRWEGAFEAIVRPGVAGRRPQARWLPDLGQDLARGAGAAFQARWTEEQTRGSQSLPLQAIPSALDAAAHQKQFF